MTEANNGSLLKAMLAVQAEAPTLQKDGRNPAYGGSRYATLHTVVETIRPKLVEHDLVWTTLPTTNEHGQPALRYRLEHVPTGQKIEDTAPLLLGKVDSQGLGSALTYMRRYTLCAVLNLVADDDDDGNAAASSQSGRRVDPVSSRKEASGPQKALVKRLVTQHKPPLHVLNGMLQNIGFPGEATEGWVDRLGSRDASKLIDFFNEGVLPDPQAQDIPTDLPEPADADWDKVMAENEAPGA